MTTTTDLQKAEKRLQEIKEEISLQVLRNQVAELKKPMTHTHLVTLELHVIDKQEEYAESFLIQEWVSKEEEVAETTAVAEQLKIDLQKEEILQKIKSVYGGYYHFIFSVNCRELSNVETFLQEIDREYEKYKWLDEE